MGLFDRDEAKGEVRIDVPDESSGSELHSEVESKFGSSQKSEKRLESSKGSDSVSNRDIYEQNQKIIRLLEKLVDEEEKEETNTSNVGEGMNELL
ncbi:MAG: hypothetical protein H8Z69_05310 [Nanohaloarchaea archaeon]|nr:hypothetical protein [Candidatus Nanohaloarchaea archaeon]